MTRVGESWPLISTGSERRSLGVALLGQGGLPARVWLLLASDAQPSPRLTTMTPDSGHALTADRGS